MLTQTIAASNPNVEVDVYISLSFTRLEKGVYELGNFNSFIITPVSGTPKFTVQYSEDDDFGPTMESKLTLTNKSAYETADLIDWPNA